MNDYVDELVASWGAARPDLDTAPLAVISRILRTAQAIQVRLDSLIGAEPELSHKGDLDTLSALRRAGRPLSPSLLAQVGQLTSGGTTNRLDRLEAAGLVSRQPDPHDRRGVLVSLTKDGSRLADTAIARSLEAQRDLLAPLSSAEQQAMAAGLRTLLLALGDAPLGLEID